MPLVRVRGSLRKLTGDLQKALERFSIAYRIGVHADQVGDHSLRFAGGHAGRSIRNRPVRRNWRSKHRSMVRKRPCGC